MPLKSGDVVAVYPYLWNRQHLAGETEGRKPRPVCVVLAIQDKAGNTHLALLPMSSQKPDPGQTAIKLPTSERTKLGFDSAKEVWIYVSEYNYDIEQQSYYLARSRTPIRTLSSSFLKKVAMSFGEKLRAGAARVPRR